MEKSVPGTYEHLSRRQRFLIPSLTVMGLLQLVFLLSARDRGDVGLGALSAIASAAIVTVPLLAVLSSPALLFRTGRTMDGWLRAYTYAAIAVNALLILFILAQLLLSGLRPS